MPLHGLHLWLRQANCSRRDGFAYDFENLVVITPLRQKIEGTNLECFDSRIHSAVRGQHDHRHFRVQFKRAPE